MRLTKANKSLLSLTFVSKITLNWFMFFNVLEQFKEDTLITNPRDLKEPDGERRKSPVKSWEQSTDCYIVPMEVILQKCAAS